jgi:hypothetical protein
LLPGIDEALIFELRIMPEIDKKSDLVPGGVEVVDDLGAVFVGQHGHSLEFQDDILEADEVGFVGLAKRTAFLFQAQRFLGDEGDAFQAKFNLHALLIYCLQKTAALLLVNLEASANDAVRFVFV